MPNRDLGAARDYVAEAVARLAEHARYLAHVADEEESL